MIMKTSLITLIGVFSAILIGCGYPRDNGDLVSNDYKLLTDAVRSGAIESGWLPRDMPASAHDIFEVHNVDTGEVWVKFRFIDDDLGSMLDKCVKGSLVDLPDSRRTINAASWWPEELLAGTESEVVGWSIFRCPEMMHARSLYSSRLAISDSEDLAFYWLP